MGVSDDPGGVRAAACRAGLERRAGGYSPRHQRKSAGAYRGRERPVAVAGALPVGLQRCYSAAQRAAALALAAAGANLDPAAAAVIQR